MVLVQRIFLLEDDEDLGRGICLALEGSQTQVRRCTTLAQAKQAGFAFDLMILDVNLPDGSGLDFLRQVRKESAVPVILLTANDMETDIVTGLESGADDYITKPFSLAVDLGRGICLALEGSQTQVRRCTTLAQAKQAGFAFDLMILDVNLPDGSGLDFLRQVRKESAVPVILLTANDMETDIVTGLESGADDYITKPFSLAVLRARVNACLRRGRSAKR